MIYVGFQGVGKTSIAGKNNCIDLDSNLCRVDGRKSSDWCKVYCNIAENLSNQGYKVFVSCGKVIREELKNRNIDFITITPSLEIKEKWLKRLKDRYKRTHLGKDLKSLVLFENYYELLVSDLLQEKNVIVINDTNYNLEDKI